MARNAYKLIAAISFCILLTGCNSLFDKFDKDNPGRDDNPLNATLESSVWRLGDEIKLFGLDEEGKPKSASYKADAAGQNSTFSYFDSKKDSTFIKGQTIQYALYPYSDYAYADGSKITFILPTVQHYQKGAFGIGANVSVAAYNKGDLNMKSTLGGVNVILSAAEGSTIKIGRIVLTDKTGILTGEFSADAAAEAPAAASTGQGGNVVTLECGSIILNPGSEVAFQIAVPAGSLAGTFTVDVYSSSDHLITSASFNSGLSIKRNELSDITIPAMEWIPSEYQEIPYLRATGTQYIETEFIPGEKWSLEMRFQLNSLKKNEQMVFGTFASEEQWTSNRKEGYGVGYYYTSRFTSWSSDTKFTYNITDQALNVGYDYYLKHECINRATSCSMSFEINESYANFDYPNILYNDGGVVLFNGIAKKANSGSNACADIYYAKIYDNGTLVRDFIPVYNRNGSHIRKYGLYDLVNKKLYTNANESIDSGDFQGDLTEAQTEDNSLEFRELSFPEGKLISTIGDHYYFVFPDNVSLYALSPDFKTSASVKYVSIKGQQQTSGYTKHDFSTPVTYTLNGYDNSQKTVTITAYNFHLPTVWIETADHVGITSKEIWQKGASIKIYDGVKLDNLGTTQVKGRGNSTWNYVKKPYTIKLGSKEAVLGMPKDKRWDLLANWMDRTDMRNDIALELARRSPGLDWTPHGAFVELILNGEHLGNYYLCEHVKISPDRVDIKQMDEDDPPSDMSKAGYLIELDSYFDEVNRWRTKTLNLPANLKDPDWTKGFDITYIQNWMDNLEAKICALTANNAASSDYQRYLDIDSFIDWFFVYEMTINSDPNNPKSVKMYKDAENEIDNRLHAGPCWDFDYQTFLPARGGSWALKHTAFWYPYLFRDPAFTKRAKEKWEEQKYIYRDVADGYLEDVRKEISNSVYVDKTIWPCTSTLNYDNELSFDEAVDRIKQALIDKITWMDQQFQRM